MIGKCQKCEMYSNTFSYICSNENCKNCICMECDEKVQECRECNSDMIRYNLEDEKKYKCEYCDKKFNYHEVYMKHLELFHKKITKTEKSESDTDSESEIIANVPITDILSRKIGIPNYINSCYINSVFQLLKSNGLLELLYLQYENLTYIHELVKTIRKEYCELVGISETEQCDANYFLTYCLDKLLDNNNTELREKYRFNCKYSKTCPTCKHIHINEKVENALTIYVNENTNITNAMRDSLKTEVSLRCDNCSKQNDKENKTMICKISYDKPEYLILSIQNNNPKANCEIYYGIILGKTPLYEYKLIGIISHYGKYISHNISSGHYISYILDENEDKWYEYNDNIVKEMDDDDMDDLLNSKSVKITKERIVTLLYKKHRVVEENEDDE